MISCYHSPTATPVPPCASRNDHHIINRSHKVMDLPLSYPPSSLLIPPFVIHVGLKKDSVIVPLFVCLISLLLLTTKFIIIYFAPYYLDSSHLEAVGRTLNTPLPYLLWLCLCSGHRQDLESENIGNTTSLSEEISRPFLLPLI